MNPAGVTKRFVMVSLLSMFVVAVAGCGASYVSSGALITRMDSADRHSFKAEVNDSDVPVLVVFGVTECRSVCESCVKVVEDIAHEYDGWIRFVTINVDNSPAIASSCGITAVPTVVLYDGKKEVERKVGAVTAGELRAMFNRVLDIENP